jgi:hypothetical protein
MLMRGFAVTFSVNIELPEDKIGPDGELLDEYDAIRAAKRLIAGNEGNVEIDREPSLDREVV